MLGKAGRDDEPPREAYAAEKNVADKGFQGCFIEGEKELAF